MNCIELLDYYVKMHPEIKHYRAGGCDCGYNEVFGFEREDGKWKTRFGCYCIPEKEEDWGREVTSEDVCKKINPINFEWRNCPKPF